MSIKVNLIYPYLNIVWYRMLPILKAVSAKIAAPGKSLCSKKIADYTSAAVNQISYLPFCVYIYIHICYKLNICYTTTSSQDSNHPHAYPLEIPWNAASSTSHRANQGTMYSVPQQQAELQPKRTQGKTGCLRGSLGVRIELAIYHGLLILSS